MKINLNTRFASISLAIGFFFACSTSKPGIETLVEQQLFTEALTEIDAMLAANPNQPELHIKKGEIYLSTASQFDPEERRDSYELAVSSFEAARQLALSPEQEAHISMLLLNGWENEFTNGTDIYELTNATDTYPTAISHFANAIILQPDSSSAYLSQAVALYQDGKIEDAIDILNLAKNHIDPVPAKVYEYLGFLHLQNGDATQSVFYYELANTDVSSNKNIAFGLVNTYIMNGETEKAVQLLSQLVINFPGDAPIHNVYGTQLYHIASGIIDDLLRAYTSGDSGLVDQLTFEAEGVSEQAEHELVTAYELDTTNSDYVESLAVFYLNMTKKYLEAYDAAFVSDKQMMDAKAEILLGFAIQYYEKLGSFNPELVQIEQTLSTLRYLQTIRYSSN